VLLNPVVLAESALAPLPVLLKPVNVRFPATWTVQSSGATDTLYAVSFVDANTGWVVGGARNGSHGDS